MHLIHKKIILKSFSWITKDNVPFIYIYICFIDICRITNEEVRRRCGVENLEHKLRKMKLMRWFGHVKCRNENSILRRLMEL